MQKSILSFFSKAASSPAEASPKKVASATQQTVVQQPPPKSNEKKNKSNAIIADAAEITNKTSAASNSNSNSNNKPRRKISYDSDEEEEYVPVSSKRKDRESSSSSEDDDDYSMEIDEEEKSKKKTTPSKKMAILSPSGSAVASTKRNVPTTPNKKVDNAARYKWLEDVRDKQNRKCGEEGYDGRTLLVPKAAFDSFTSFEKQFWSIKSEHWDTVIFFKKGKFYELYEKDADIGFHELGLKMTDRVNMRMVGVPEKSFKKYASLLITAGYRVGRVEQMETMNAANKRRKDVKSPSKETKVCNRELCEILTRGTLVEEEMLPGPEANFLMTVCENPSTRQIGVCLVDVSVGSFYLHSFADDEQHSELETILLRCRPKEIVVPKPRVGQISEIALKLIKRNVEASALVMLEPTIEFWDYPTTLKELSCSSYFGDNSADRSTWPPLLQDLANDGKEFELSALGGCISYLRHLLLDLDVVGSGSFSTLSSLSSDRDRLILDGQTLSNLFILENDDGGREGTLLKHLDRCATAFGRRLLKNWVSAPLRDTQELNKRYDAIEALAKNPGLRNELVEMLRKLPDLERGIARLHTVSSRKQGVMFDNTTNRKLKEFALLLDGFDALVDVWKHIPPDMPLCGFLQPPSLTQPLAVLSKSFDRKVARVDGTVIVGHGVIPEFDEAAAKRANINEKLTKYLDEMKKKMNLSSLHYWSAAQSKEPNQLVVPAEWINRNKVPDDWKIMSQTSKCSRYWTDFLKTTTSELVDVEEDMDQATRLLTSYLVTKFCEDKDAWRQAVEATAQLDVLISLSYTVDAQDGPTCRPQFLDFGLECRELRHPCLAARNGNFVANDIVVGCSQVPPTIIVTGPNMGGKSTLLRQVCIGVIMAQVGAFVPGEHFAFAPIDRIFTRIGAHDRMMAGQSTFMVEMRETASILRYATEKSLVILDELGRGTATFDGYAIAFAVLVELVKMKCMCLFSTHYQMLTQHYIHSDEVALRHMTCLIDDENKNVTFLYKFADGVAPRSYGVHCASLASIPRVVVDRAAEQALEMEQLTSLTADPSLHATVKALVTTSLFDSIDTISKLQSIIAKRLCSEQQHDSICL